MVPGITCADIGVWQYNLVITEHDNWVGGDGVAKKKAMLINGQFPGTEP